MIKSRHPIFRIPFNHKTFRRPPRRHSCHRQNHPRIQIIRSQRPRQIRRTQKHTTQLCRHQITTRHTIHIQLPIHLIKIMKIQILLHRLIHHKSLITTKSPTQTHRPQQRQRLRNLRSDLIHLPLQRIIHIPQIQLRILILHRNQFRHTINIARRIAPRIIRPIIQTRMILLKNRKIGD